MFEPSLYSQGIPLLAAFVAVYFILRSYQLGRIARWEVGLVCGCVGVAVAGVVGFSTTLSLLSPILFVGYITVVSSPAWGFVGVVCLRYPHHLAKLLRVSHRRVESVGSTLFVMALMAFFVLLVYTGVEVVLDTVGIVTAVWRILIYATLFTVLVYALSLEADSTAQPVS